jgi:hypothetical protein
MIPVNSLSRIDNDILEARIKPKIVWSWEGTPVDGYYTGNITIASKDTGLTTDSRYNYFILVNYCLSFNPESAITTSQNIPTVTLSYMEQSSGSIHAATMASFPLSNSWSPCSGIVVNGSWNTARSARKLVQVGNAAPTKIWLNFTGVSASTRYTFMEHNIASFISMYVLALPTDDYTWNTYRSNA